MKVTVSGIEQAFTTKGAEYLKVKVVDESGKETTKTVFDNLKDKWELLTEGAYVDFKMEKRGQFWNVIDITPLDGEAPIEPEPLPEPKPQYAPQEIGMWFKSMGDRIGDGSLAKAFPNTHVRIESDYFKKMSEVTGIPF